MRKSCKMFRNTYVRRHPTYPNFLSLSTDLVPCYLVASISFLSISLTNWLILPRLQSSLVIVMFSIAPVVSIFRCSFFSDLVPSPSCFFLLSPPYFLNPLLHPLLPLSCFFFAFSESLIFAVCSPSSVCFFPPSRSQPSPPIKAAFVSVCLFPLALSVLSLSYHLAVSCLFFFSSFLFFLRTPQPATEPPKNTPKIPKNTSEIPKMPVCFFGGGYFLRVPKSQPGGCF